MYITMICVSIKIIDMRFILIYKCGVAKRKNKVDVLLVRMTPGEKQAFKDAADLAGIPVSAWMRERLRRAARRELEEAGRKIAFLHYPSS